MKRILFTALSLVLALLFVFPATAFAAKEKAFTIEKEESGNGTFTVSVCWQGAEEDDNICLLRFSLSYDSEKLTCKSWKQGGAMRDFSIRTGPQYTESNPATFLGMNISRAVTSEGELCVFEFEKKTDSVTSAEVTLEVKELLSLDETSVLDKFSVEKTEVLDFGGGESSDAEGALYCEKNADYHDTLAWTVDPENPNRFVRSCPWCKKVLSERYSEDLVEDNLSGEEGSLVPSVGLPSDAQLSAQKVDRTPNSREWPEILQSAGRDDLVPIAAYEMKLSWSGGEMTLPEFGTVTLSVPENVQDGKTLYVAAQEDGVWFVYAREVTQGTVSFPTRGFGIVYLMQPGEGFDPTPEDQLIPENEAPAEPNVPKPEENNPQDVPSQDVPSRRIFVIVSVSLVCVIGAAFGLVLFFKHKKEKGNRA